MRLSALISEGSHFPPTPAVFWQPLFGTSGHFAITRPMFVLAITVVILGVFLVASTRKLSMVPNRRQFFAEWLYEIPRNAVGRDLIGEDKMRPYLPLLFTLFITIWLNNIMAVVPFVQYPTMSRIGFPLAMTAVVYLIYLGIGFARHGFIGFFSRMVPKGVPAAVVPLLLVIETMTYFLVRPLTLTMRLFANMFAGHMLLLVFMLGGWEMMKADSVMIQAASMTSFGMSIVMTIFELLVQFLQAYVFTLLAGFYIADALADEH